MKKLFVFLFVLCVCSSFAGGLPGGGGSSGGANTSLSNVVPLTGRTNLGVYSTTQVDAAIATEAATRLASDSNPVVSGISTHVVASGGYAIYQGNTLQFAAAGTATKLPINGSSKSISVNLGLQSGYVSAVVVASTVGSGTRNSFRLWSDIASGPLLTTMGASSTIQSCTAIGDKPLFAVHISPIGTGAIEIIASGPINTLWQVKKLEIGGL